MSKLVYRTKPPKKGWINYESFLTHQSTGFPDIFPNQDVQKKAMDKVDKSLRDLIQELEVLGYDSTKVRFQIHFKE